MNSKYIPILEQIPWICSGKARAIMHNTYRTQFIDIVPFCGNTFFSNRSSRRVCTPGESTTIEKK